VKTLDDLRTTLAREADGVGDPDRYARPVAVHERIRTLRRRRATVAAAAAVLAVLTGSTTVAAVLDRDDSVEPATRLFGVDVPDHVTVDGLGYAVEDTTVLDGGERTHLDGGTADRAVSLVASGLGAGSATLYLDGEAVSRAFGDDAVELPVPIGAPSGDLRLEVEGVPADAHTGVAVYRATGEMPAGVTDGRVVFRDRRADDTLLAGAFAAPGESSVTVTVRASLADLRFSDYCATEEKGLWFNVSVDGDGSMGGECHDRPDETGDVSGAWASFADTSAPVRKHTVRAYLTRGAQGPEVSAHDVSLGLGVYGRGSAPRDVLRFGVDQTVEWRGRTWVLDRLVRQPSGNAPVDTTVDTTGSDLLVGYVARGSVHLRWSGRLDRGRSVGMDTGDDGAGSSLAGVLLEGDRYQVTVSSAGAGPFEAALLIYRPV
jgi:hypothetical protein